MCKNNSCTCRNLLRRNYSCTAKRCHAICRKTLEYFLQKSVKILNKALESWFLHKCKSPSSTLSQNNDFLFSLEYVETLYKYTYWQEKVYLLLTLILNLCCYGQEISIPEMLSLKIVSVELYLPVTNTTVNLDKWYSCVFHCQITLKTSYGEVSNIAKQNTFQINL